MGIEPRLAWLGPLLKTPEAKKYKQPTGAFSECYRASLKVMSTAQGAGLAPRLIKLEMQSDWLQASAWAADKGLYPYTESWCHYIVMVGDDCIDLTWRQFYPDSPFPRVTTLEEALEDWACFDFIEEEGTQ